MIPEFSGMQLFDVRVTYIMFKRLLSIMLAYPLCLLDFGKENIYFVLLIFFFIILIFFLSRQSNFTHKYLKNLCKAKLFSMILKAKHKKKK